MATNNDILAALNEIIDKIGAIDPCTPVSVNLPNITLVCGDCGGIEPEGPDVAQGDPPPAGYEPDPGIDSRKCKAANYIHDQIYNLIFTLNQIGVDTILGFAYAQQNQMIYTALFGAGILANAFAFVANVVDEMVKYINNTTITLASVLSAMDAGKTNLVCALYNAQSTSQAKNDYIAELQNQGITDAETISVFGYFLINDVTRMLFHAIPGSEGALDGYISAVDCASCNTTLDVLFTYGTVTGDPLSLGQITIDSAFRDYGSGYELSKITWNKPVQFTIVSITGWAADDEISSYVRNHICDNQVFFNARTQVPSGVYCAESIQLTSQKNNPVSITIDITNLDCGC